MIRFVICVDVEADDLENAYRDLHLTMRKTGYGWESSDEAYDPAGDQYSAEELQRARAAYFSSSIR